MDLLFGVCISYLILVFIGLNVTGPVRYEQASNEQVITEIKREYPRLSDFTRHSYRYVTYASKDDNTSYFFNDEGELIVSKAYSNELAEQAYKIAQKYGFERTDMQLGYGYNNPVFVFENGDKMLLLDYDTLEEVSYIRSFEYE